MPKKSKRRSWTSSDVRTLKTMARRKSRAASIARTLKRTEGATRQKAFSLGLSLEFAFLIRQARATPGNSSPASLRGFSLMLAYFGRRYVNLLRMAGFAWHLYPETASKPHLSNEVSGAIILASQRMECFVTEFLKITECTRSEQMTILPFLTLVSNQFAQIDRLFLAHPEVLTVDGMF